MSKTYWACVETYGRNGSPCCSYVTEKLPDKYTTNAGCYESEAEARSAAKRLYQMLRDAENAKKHAEYDRLHAADLKREQMREFHERRRRDIEQVESHDGEGVVCATVELLYSDGMVIITSELDRVFEYIKDELVNTIEGEDLQESQAKDWTGVKWDFRIKFELHTQHYLDSLGEACGFFD